MSPPPSADAVTAPDPRRLGASLTLFVVAQVLHALAALALLAVTAANLARVNGTVTLGAMGGDAEVAAVRVLAIGAGLWLLARRHPSTPRLWTAYFALSFCWVVLTRGTRGAPAFMEVAHALGWLAFWVRSGEVRRVFGSRGLD